MWIFSSIWVLFTTIFLVYPLVTNKVKYPTIPMFIIVMIGVITYQKFRHLSANYEHIVEYLTYVQIVVCVISGLVLIFTRRSNKVDKYYDFGCTGMVLTVWLGINIVPVLIVVSHFYT